MLSSFTNLVLSKWWILLCLTVVVLMPPFCTSQRQTDRLMLLDGLFKNEGTVYVYSQNRWGPICDDNWGFREANIVCTELGYSYALKATRNDFFKSERGETYAMDDVSCTGNEASIFDCVYWTDHDCGSSRAAGVICFEPPDQAVHYKPWNPLGLPYNQSVIQTIEKKNFQILFKRKTSINDTSDIHLSFVTVDNVIGGICPDNFGLLEATVLCSEINQGYGQRIIRVNTAELSFNQNVVRFRQCYGNETFLNRCHYYATSDPNLCSVHNETVGVVCAKALPDLAPDVPQIQTSLYMDIVTLRRVSCAVEEGCFPLSVYRMAQRFPESYFLASRRLLRFTSIIMNMGSADFQPYEDRENWEWHACHQHFHSMKKFAFYEIYDLHKRKLTVGHKASFCLEDNMCAKGVKKKFICSSLKSNKGTQGISPGCSDNYLHNYDCQWIDVSELKSGIYIFRVILNPDFLVPELTWSNNGVSCTLNLGAGSGHLSACRMVHPLDPV